MSHRARLCLATSLNVVAGTIAAVTLPPVQAVIVFVSAAVAISILVEHLGGNRD